MRIQRGHDLTETERREGRVPVVGSAGANGFHDVALAAAPGVVIGRSGASFGQVHLCREDYWPHNTALYVTDFLGNDPRFTYYFLKGLDFSRYNSGSAQPSLNRNFVYPIEVRIPDLDEQRAIAHILGTLDDKIELNRRMSETLEAMARALFKSWFVDREAGPLADAAELPLVDLKNFAALNPESWSATTRPALLRYVDLSSVKWGRIDSVVEHAREEAPSRAQRILRPGDVIVGTVRPANGSYALIDDDGLTGSTGFAVLRPKAAHYVEFVYLAATSSENLEALGHLADGGAYPAVRPEVVAATPVPQPPDSALVSFSRIVQPLFGRLADAERESRTLATLRDTLLPKLTSGEMRVKDAERFVGLSA
ncbi:MAG: restriction endonuclease subunit S [Acidobacteriota bacterium]|nr:restriction endonuclease subunit S [Acidobacteriota bacterium]